jgi:hypothetical protein
MCDRLFSSTLDADWTNLTNSLGLMISAKLMATTTDIEVHALFDLDDKLIIISFSTRRRELYPIFDIPPSSPSLKRTRERKRNFL